MRITTVVSLLVLTQWLTACAPLANRSNPSGPAGGLPAVKAAAAAPAGQSDAPLDRTLTLQGITFHVISPNQGSINELRIEPNGLKADNSPVEREIEGTVTNVEVADLNADGSPELYIYLTSAGSGSYGSLVAYAVNHGKSMSEIALPPLEENPAATKGYMGHDQFAVVENRLVRRFPVYQPGDTNAAPTGGQRQVHYILKAGEAGWLLRPDKTVDF